MNVRPSVLLIQNNQVLLMQYCYGGHDVFALPGGNPDKGETLRETVARELLEELGVTVEVGKLLLCGDVLMPDGKKDVLHVVFLGEIIAGLPALNPAETSALALVWKPIADLHTLNLYPNVGRQIQEQQGSTRREPYVGRIDQAFF